VVLILLSICIFINSSHAGVRVLVIASESGDPTWTNITASYLNATGYFEQVDFVDLYDSTPNLTTLQQYNSVLFYTDSPPPDPVGFGDILHSYINGGGGVVAAQFELETSYALHGAYNASDRVIGLGNQLENTRLTASASNANVSNHWILQGLNSCDGGSASFHSSGSLVEGATLILEWSDGTPLLAERTNVGAAGVTRVDFNLFPPSSTARDDFWDISSDCGKMIARSLLYVAGYLTTGTTGSTGTTGTTDTTGSTGTSGTTSTGTTGTTQASKTSDGSSHQISFLMCFVSLLFLVLLV